MAALFRNALSMFASPGGRHGCWRACKGTRLPFWLRCACSRHHGLGEYWHALLCGLGRTWALLWGKHACHAWHVYCSPCNGQCRESAELGRCRWGAKHLSWGLGEAVWQVLL